MPEHRPTSEDELAEVVREAAARGEGLAITGGGTRAIGHPVAGTPLAVSGISGITLYEPGALTLVVRAGTPLAEVEAALAAEGQRLPFEPWDARALTGANGTPTVGGMVAVNASGPRRIQAGACRDSLIGVRFVDGRGDGGEERRAGDEERDRARPGQADGGEPRDARGADRGGVQGAAGGARRWRRWCWTGSTTAAAGRAMTAAMATPYDVSGAAHLPGEATTLVRVEGFAASVAHRARELVRALAGFGAARIVEGPGPWAAVRDAAAFGGREGAVWRVSVKPTDGPLVGARLAGAERIYDWAGGLVWVLAAEDFDLRGAMAGLAGHATLVRASEAATARWGVFHPEPAPVAALSAGLRAEFDPEGVLNPGRMAARAVVAA